DELAVEPWLENPPASVKGVAPGGEARLEGEERVLLAGSSAPEMKHVIAPAPSPRARVIQEDLERRQVPQVLVRPGEMGLDDAVQFSEQTRSADGVSATGQQQVEAAAQRLAQASHVRKAQRVFRAGSAALHRFAVEAREALDLGPAFIDLG